jgi:serine/threonine protein kinase
MKKPSVFGKYLLLERLNVGGMAEVFVAKAFGVEGFERILAIKKILPTMAEDEEFITMFIDEARISVQLNHANIVHIHELGKHDEAYYIAMEYVSGRDLRAILERFRRRKEIMPTAMAVFVATRICEGLDYAHRKRDARGIELHIIHRDISPQNIILSYEGEVKLIDFGIAKAANRSQKTQAGILKGKFGYMSPEQVRGLPIDRRSDIFAVGVLLYEMLAGEKLFVGESDFSTLEKVRNAEIPALRQFNPDIPAKLEAVVRKALARDCQDRYQWANDLQEDLMRFLLAGDAIYSAKHLASYMKSAFAEEILREAEKMERFATIGRPDQIEASAIIAAPRKVSLGQTSVPPTLASTRERTPETVGVGAGPVAHGRQEVLSAIQATFDLADGEDADVGESSRDRTVIVDPRSVPVGETEIGLPPAKHEPGEFRSRESSSADAPVTYAPAEISPGRAKQSADSVNPAAPRSLREDRSNSRNALRASEPQQPMTGKGQRQSSVALAQSNGSAVPRLGRQQIVIGDAPVNGATTIGKSPTEDGTNEWAASGDTDGAAPIPSRQAARSAGLDVGGGENDTLDPLIHSDPAPTPLGGARNHAKVKTRNSDRPGAIRRRRRWLWAGVALGVCALFLAGVMLARLFGGRTGMIVEASPQVPFTVKINQGNKFVGDSSRPIELAPGDYAVEAVPSAPGFLGVRKKVTIRSGAVERIAVVFERQDVETPQIQDVQIDRTRLDAGTSREKSDGGMGRIEASHQQAGSRTQAGDRKQPPHADAPSYTLVILSDEPGIEISIGGKIVGRTPSVVVRGVSLNGAVEGVARKRGFATRTFSLENAERTPRLEFRLVLDRIPAPETPPAASPKDVPPDAARKDSKATDRSKKATGKLMCNSKPVGAEVWIDGRNSGRKTPVAKTQEIELPAGRHSVVFKLEGKSTPPQEVVILTDETVTVKSEL